MAGVVPNVHEKDPAQLTRAIRDLFAGRSNAVGSVTLTTGAASTVVSAINCGAGSKVFLFPTTANAAAELGNGTMYVSAVAKGQFTITHANSATSGRTFFWVALG